MKSQRSSKYRHARSIFFHFDFQIKSVLTYSKYNYYCVDIIRGFDWSLTVYQISFTSLDPLAVVLYEIAAGNHLCR